MFIIAGVPGAGKTTILKKARERLEKVEVVVFGDIMYEIARERGLVKDRDEIRKLPMSVQVELQEQAAMRIEELARGDRDLIVDTHCLIKTPYGYFPGLPQRVISRLRPSLIALIESNPRDIVRRRGKDVKRNRDLEEEEEIRDHQLMNRMAAVAYSALTGANIVIIRNVEGKVEDAVNELVEVVEGF